MKAALIICAVVGLVTTAAAQPLTFRYQQSSGWESPGSATWTGTYWYWVNGDLLGVLTEIADDTYELQVYPLNITPDDPITRIAFPYELTVGLDDPSATAAFYVPMLDGRVILQSVLDGNWTNIATYPELYYSAFLVLADEDESAIVHAMNWPIRDIEIKHSQNKIQFEYPGTLAELSSYYFYTYYETDIRGDSSIGDHPWRKGVSRYKTWLHAELDANSPDLQPNHYPAWLKATHGWLGVGLHSIPGDDEDVRDTLLDLWENVAQPELNYVQAWGQMSGFDGSCCDLTEDPPLDGLHARNALVPNAATAIVGDNGYFGYYTRPRRQESPAFPSLAHARITGNETLEVENRDWFDDWNDATWVDWEGNARYFDTFGIANSYGNVLQLAARLKTDWPEAVVEWTKDCYPAAYLTSGLYIDQGKLGPSSGGPFEPRYEGDPQHYTGVVDAHGKPIAPESLTEQIAFEGIKVEMWDVADDAELTSMPFPTTQPANKVVYEQTLFPIKYDSGRIDSDWSFIDSFGQDFTASVGGGSAGKNFYLRASGFVRVDYPGDHEFYVGIGRGGQAILKLKIDNVWTTIVDTSASPPDGCGSLPHNTECAELSDSVDLDRGTYEMELTYYNGTQYVGKLQLGWHHTGMETLGYSTPTDWQYIHELFHNLPLDRCTFPELGRYMMDRHVMFLGQSNRGSIDAGYINSYRNERTAFLLGAKFDTLYAGWGSCSGCSTGCIACPRCSSFWDYRHPDFPLCFLTSPPTCTSERPIKNAVMMEAIAEREAVGWWSKNLVYKGSEGIYGISNEKVRVSRFIDLDDGNKSWFCVDNWTPDGGGAHRLFYYDGMMFQIPTKNVAILSEDDGIGP